MRLLSHESFSAKQQVQMTPSGSIIFLSLWLLYFCTSIYSKTIHSHDICGFNNGRRVYIEFGETGSLTANYENAMNTNRVDMTVNSQKKCTMEFITCPSCMIEINFSFLNISRNCGKTTVLDTCGCDYLWIYEPPFDDVSGEQFCGRFIATNTSILSYKSQTRTVAVVFLHSGNYGHAFTFNYSSKRNRIQFVGNPVNRNMNNFSQTLSSPFFPYYYPNDLSMEYVIKCESVDKCRISLVFSDFQIAHSSIIEFYDWNGQRMYVTSGNIFRPPVIISTGPTLVIRFYANGASSFGFKTSYFFILDNLNNAVFTPDIDCGGYVNNLGGAITMMNMLPEGGTKFYDCVWIIKPPSTFSHMKTHLYVKALTFLEFASSAELTIRQGLTSNEPSVEVLRHPKSSFFMSKQKEHVVALPEGFYISLRGLFNSRSRLAIVYAAFNYKDCFAGSDFLCHNLRCISVLLTCDGFDHCGDNSDESPSCAEDSKDRRRWPKTPNFIFPKMEQYSDLTAATLIFLVCSFGLIGIILAMTLLLYRLNVKARHQRQIQDHIETIHAILDEGGSDVIEEIVVPDDPPDYEAPPDYGEVLKYRKQSSSKSGGKRCVRCKLPKNNNVSSILTRSESNGPSCETPSPKACTSQTCQILLATIPDSPPPAYVSGNVSPASHSRQVFEFGNDTSSNTTEEHNIEEIVSNTALQEVGPSSSVNCFENIKHIKVLNDIRTKLKNCKSASLFRNSKRLVSISDENLVKKCRSDSELVFLSRMSFNFEVFPQNQRFSQMRLRRSYSTDDIFSLIQ